MTRLWRIAALSLAGALSVPAAASAKLPTVLTVSAGPFAVRPATISYTGDGTGIVGGPNGRSVRHLGRLRWTTYNQREGRGRGLVWLDDCDPNCAQGTFDSTPVSVHVFSPTHGHFRYLTLKFTNDDGEPVTDRRVVRRHGRFWTYDITGHG